MKYDVIFRQISKFLLIKPKLDVENLPEFFIFFFNSSLHFKSHRSWMLNLLQRGVRDTHDFHVIERRQVVSTLMCFYDSLLSDNTSRSQVLQVGALDKNALFHLYIHFRCSQESARSLMLFQSSSTKEDYSSGCVKLFVMIMTSLTTVEAIRASDASVPLICVTSSPLFASH